jgi:hypothetical protein
MTVKVTLRNGDADNYMRFGDAYVKHHDGKLDVVRTGAKRPFSYASGSGPTSKVTRSGSPSVSGVDGRRGGARLTESRSGDLADELPALLANGCRLVGKPFVLAMPP